MKIATKDSILKDNLRQHQIHSKNKQFKCNECSYQTLRHRDLNEHIQMKHTR